MSLKKIGAKVLSKGAMIVSSLGLNKINLTINEIIVSGVVITAVWTPTFISIIADKIKEKI